MTEDEKIKRALKKAVDMIHEVAPDLPFIFVHAAGLGHSYNDRLYNGTPSQINAAIKNTMLHTAIVCASAMNSVIAQAAKKDPMFRKLLVPNEALAVDLLAEVYDKLQSGMEKGK